MPNAYLVDLDELVLRCRNEQAKSYIAEAVSCYKAGAFRACVVATWIAVVFDFLHKLEELRLTGDKNAKTRLEEFEKFRKNEDVVGSQTFERKIPDMAKNEFELISAVEHEDLLRLQKDRHRCAHPSMTVAGEAFQPSAELARYHLRNVVDHLLQYPPVQGKPALDWIFQSIDSEYFPANAQKALISLASGPLAHPRDSLVRSLVIEIMNAVLGGELGEDKQQHYLAALNATRMLHHELVESVLSSKLNGLVVKLPDKNLICLLELLGRVTDLWQYLGDDVRTRLEAFVSNLPKDLLVQGLCGALAVPELRSFALQQIQNATASVVAELAKLPLSPMPTEILERAVGLYCDSGSFAQANTIGTEIIVPLVPYMTVTQIENVVECAATNDQIRGSFELRPVLNWLRMWYSSEGEFDVLLIEHGLKEKLMVFDEDMAF